MGKRIVICGVDTNRLPKLSAKESRECLEAVKRGDKSAREHFINCNLRLVLSVVQKFSHRCENADDLFQIGCVGLIKAVENFDLSHGVRFSTYAVPMIAGEIRRYIRESNSMRVSRGIRDTAYKPLVTRDEIESESGGEATMESIAERMHIPVYDVIFCLDAISDPVSLFDNVYSDEEDAVTYADHLSDDKVSEDNWSESISLNDALNSLDEKERNILIKRYFEGKTQTEVSKEIGLSQAQVSRLESNAVGHLRSALT